MDDFFPFLYIDQKDEDLPFAQISLYIEDVPHNSIEKKEMEEARVIIMEIL
jgi:hypothetical protein